MSDTPPTSLHREIEPLHALSLGDRQFTLMTGSLVILATAAVLAMLYLAKPILAPTAIGILLAVTLSPIHRRLVSVGLHRIPAAGLSVLAPVVAALAGAYALAPSYDDLRGKLPEFVERLQRALDNVEQEIAETVEQVKEVSGVTTPPAADGAVMDEPVANAANAAGAALLETPAIAASLLYIIFLAFFLLSERRKLFRTTVRLFAVTGSGRRRVGRSMRSVMRDISRYFFVISLINIALGIATTLAFLALGMPNAALWGAAMTLLNFIPYLGAAVMNAAVFFVAFFTFGSFGAALLPLGALMTLNLIEGQLITPMLVGRHVLRSSLAVFLAVAFGAWLWGAVGALLATPLLILAREVVLRLSVEETVPSSFSVQTKGGRT